MGAGRLFSTALFEEWNEDAKGDCDPIYSVEEFHKTFLECRDLTEYKPAMKLVGDWQEWNRLKSGSRQFRDCITQWKEELKVMLRSEAQSRILDLVSSENNSIGLSAAKWMAEDGWDRKVGKGRTSKAEIKREQKMLAEAAKTTEEEMNRVSKVLRLVPEKKAEGE